LGTEETRRGSYLIKLREGFKREGLAGFWRVLDAFPAVLWPKARAVFDQVRDRLWKTDVWEVFSKKATEEDLLGLVEELDRSIPPPGMGVQAIESLIRRLWPDRLQAVPKSQENEKVPRRLSYEPTEARKEPSQPSEARQEETREGVIADSLTDSAEEADDTSDEALERAFSAFRATPINRSATRIFSLLIKGLGVGESRKVSRSKAFMPVSIDRLTRQTFALAHNRIQNGDLIADPDMEFFVSRSGLVYPVAIQQGALGTYYRVVEDGRVKTSQNADQANFANTWLRNIEEQQDLRDHPDVNGDGEPLRADEAKAKPQDASLQKPLPEMAGALDPKFARRLALVKTLRGEGS
jgi:hypothetical protein